MTAPVVSVVVVSDYAAGTARSWDDERACFAALAAQDFDEPAEFILCDDERYREAVPAELTTALPGSRVVFCSTGSSYGLKNAGVRDASAPIVALLDADCRPDADWLRLLVQAFRSNPGVSVVSGRTFYEGTGVWERVLCLLTRSYLDLGRTGQAAFASNNAAGFRRDVHLSHQLPENLGAFASRMQSESIRRSGGILWFEPRMRVVHEFEGWPREADIRRNIGYGTVATRLADDSMPYASLVRVGAAAIPLIVAGKLLNTWRDCVRCSRFYGVQWHELPLALAAAVPVQAMEIPGMIAAYRGRSVGASAYR